MASNPSSTSETPASQQEHLVVRHPDASVSKTPFPTEPGTELNVGRELDNDVVLVDPRSSRHHAGFRRAENGGLEVTDKGSANGTFIGSRKIAVDEWEAISPGQVVQIGDTRLNWERASATEATVSMRPVSGPKVTPAAQTSQRNLPWPWIAVGVVLALLFIVGGIALFSSLGGQDDPALVEATEANTTQNTPSAALAEDDRAIGGQNQTTPTPTITPAAAAEATPVVDLEPAFPNMIIEKVEFLPVISGALFDTQHIYMIIQARVENLGETPFQVSTNQFYLQTSDGEQVQEFGQQLAETEFSRLGVVNRFENLRLGAGGSVAEEVIFYLPNRDYADLTLIYQPPDQLDPLGMSLGQYDTERELAILLGTPVADPTEPAVAVAEVDTPTPEPTETTETPATEIEETPTAEAEDDGRASETPESNATEEPTEEATEEATEEPTEEATEEPTAEPTPTSPPVSVVAGRTIPPQSLVGTIAFADFNGASYDLFLGNVATGDKQFWRAETSQPQFSADGSRLAYHSWAGGSRGLVVSNLDQSGGFLVSNFLEDQLPTWSPDGSEILFLSRRTGTRQSQLYTAPANQEMPSAELKLEGEYPDWHPNGTVVFKGWVTTGQGLRITDASFGEVTPLTDNDNDTAPTISPNGQQVAFMSNRDGNWDIYVVNIDGSDVTRLTVDEAQDGLPTWSPDGNAIAFVSNRGGPWAVWAMTTNGTGIRQLFTYNGSPDGFVASEPSTDTTRGWAEERIDWTE